MNMTLTQLQTWLPQAVAVAGTLDAALMTHSLIKAVRTDSRSVIAGDLFVALKGDQFDGTAFLAQAQRQGAVAVLFEAQDALKGEHLQYLNDRDSNDCLGFARRCFLPIIVDTRQLEQRNWRAPHFVQSAPRAWPCRGGVGHEPSR